MHCPRAGAGSCRNCQHKCLAETACRRETPRISRNSVYCIKSHSVTTLMYVEYGNAGNLMVMLTNLTYGACPWPVLKPSRNLGSLALEPILNLPLKALAQHAKRVGTSPLRPLFGRAHQLSPHTEQFGYDRTETGTRVKCKRWRWKRQKGQARQLAKARQAPR